MERKHVFLSALQLDWLSKYSTKTGMKFAEIVRRAIDDFIVRNKK